MNILINLIKAKSANCSDNQIWKFNKCRTLKTENSTVVQKSLPELKDINESSSSHLEHEIIVDGTEVFMIILLCLIIVWIVMRRPRRQQHSAAAFYNLLEVECRD